LCTRHKQQSLKVHLPSGHHPCRVLCRKDFHLWNHMIVIGLAQGLAFVHKAQATVTAGAPDLPKGRHPPGVLCR